MIEKHQDIESLELELLSIGNTEQPEIP